MAANILDHYDLLVIMPCECSQWYEITNTSQQRTSTSTGEINDV
jgi:hypothetical protein